MSDLDCNIVSEKLKLCSILLGQESLVTFLNLEKRRD